MNLKDRVYVKPDKQVRFKVREIAVIIENRIKNSKVHEQVQEKARKTIAKLIEIGLSENWVNKTQFC